MHDQESHIALMLSWSSVYKLQPNHTGMGSLNALADSSPELSHEQPR